MENRFCADKNFLRKPYYAKNKYEEDSSEEDNS